MIDTDKYEGHTSDWKWVYIEEEREWQLYSLKSVFGNKIIHDTPDGKLAQDAPLLLEEVKRLRWIKREHGRVIIDEWDDKPHGNADAHPLPCVTVFQGGCEYVGRLRLYKNEDGKVIPDTGER